MAQRSSRVLLFYMLSFTKNNFVVSEREQGDEYDPRVSGWIPTHVRRELQPTSNCN